MSDAPTLLTFRQFAEQHPAFPVTTLRWIRFRSEPVKRTRRGRGGESVVESLSPNGLASAFIKVGGRVLGDEDEFFQCIDRQNGRSVDAA